MLSPRGQRRYDYWDDTGEILDEFTVCQRYDICEAKWAGGIPDELIEAITLHDPTYELIFDPCCREKGSLGPAFFIYKRTQPRNGSDDGLEVVMRCSEDPDMLWTDGVPKVPGMWIIPELQKRDNRNLGMSELQAAEYRATQQVTEAEIEQGKRDYALAQVTSEVEEPAAEFVDGKSTQPSRGKHRPDWNAEGPARRNRKGHRTGGTTKIISVGD